MSDPLTMPDCDLRDQPWMPFHVQRLLGSEWWLGASDAAARVSVELWCESWQQVPAASLPDNDRVLARMCGKSADEWAAIRDEVLSAWIKCSDGRWYHPTVSQMAQEAWGRKQARQNARKQAIEAGRKGAAKRWAKDAKKPPQKAADSPPNSPPISDPNTLQDKTGQDSNTDRSSLTETSVVADAPPEGQRSEIHRLATEPIPSFDAFWAEYPARLLDSGKLSKGPKSQAKGVWMSLAPATKHAAMTGLGRYKHAHPHGSKGVVDAVRYLRHRRWEDDVEEPQTADIHRVKFGSAHGWK